MKQTDRILRHIKDYGSITSWEAMQEYGIMRLASRICDIRRMGIPIRSERVSAKNRYGERISYARYTLITEPDTSYSRFMEETNGR